MISDVFDKPLRQLRGPKLGGRFLGDRPSGFNPAWVFRLERRRRKYHPAGDNSKNENEQGYVDDRHGVHPQRNARLVFSNSSKMVLQGPTPLRSAPQQNLCRVLSRDPGMSRMKLVHWPAVEWRISISDHFNLSGVELIEGAAAEASEP